MAGKAVELSLGEPYRNSIKVANLCNHPEVYRTSSIVFNNKITYFKSCHGSQSSLVHYTIYRAFCLLLKRIPEVLRVPLDAPAVLGPLLLF